MKKVFYSLFLFAFISSHAQFITTWRPTDAGQIILPLATQIDATVSYRKSGEVNPEGSFVTAGGNVVIDQLDIDLVYEVTIDGGFGYFNMNSSGVDKSTLLSVEKWGSYGWSTWDQAFTGCVNLQINASDSPNFDNVDGATGLRDAFKGCSNLTGGVAHWDVSKIKNFQHTFRSCINFTEDLSSWIIYSSDVSVSMFEMFLDASKVDFDISRWDFSGVNSLNNFIKGTNFSTKNYDLLLSKFYSEQRQFTLDATDLSYCSVSGIVNSFTGITGHEQNCSAPENSFVMTIDTRNSGESTTGNTRIRIPASSSSGTFDVYYKGLDVSNDNQVGVYYDRFESEIYNLMSSGNFEVSIFGELDRIEMGTTDDGNKLTSIESWGDIEWESFSYAFQECTNLTVTTNEVPDLRQVTSLERAFSGCTSLTSGLSNWDVSNVTNFSGMFESCSNYNEDLSSWDVGNATAFSYMFYDCAKLDFDISQWDFAQMTDVSSFLNGSGLSVENYDRFLNKLVTYSDQQSFPLFHAFSGQGLEYCKSSDARDILLARNWNLQDGLKQASQNDIEGSPISTCEPFVVIYPNSTDSTALVQGNLMGKGIKKFAIGTEDSLIYRPTDGERQNTLEIEFYTFDSQQYCDYVVTKSNVTFTPKPTVNAGGPYESYNTSAFQVNGVVENTDVIEWTSTDGGFSDINSAQTTYTPGDDGIEAGMVKLRLTAGDGDCQVSDEAFVVLKECNISVQKEVVDNIVRFTATNQNSKLLMSYVWDFGDGHVGRGRFVEHIYDQAKSYSVSLQATSDDGFCVKNASSEIVVTDIPTTNYTISGVVRVDESTVLDTGVVGLFYLSPSNNYELKQEVGIEQDGSFMFERLVAKEYYLAARAVKESNYYNSTRPTYLGNTPSWQESDPIVLSNTAPLSGYDITLSGFSIASDATFNKGEDIVRGNVTFDPDFVTKSGTRDIVDDPLPVQDAIILLYDENENLLSFTTTDEFGDFSFSDLESGIYVLVIEYIGTSISISQTIIVDGDDSTIDEFAFKITSDEDDETGIFNTSNILQSNAYPNPTSGIVNIGQNNRFYTIYSVTGDVITAGEIGSYQVDLTNLDPGIYLLEIQIDDQKLIERIVKR